MPAGRGQDPRKVQPFIQADATSRRRSIQALSHMDREVALQIQSPLDVVSRGDIFWIAADETRGSFPGSPHPHVVVQEDVLRQR